jgi:hypothetical protein
MEARVWIGTKGRFNPFQEFEEGVLSLEGDTLTFRTRHDTVSMGLSEVEFGFPLSMSGAGFVMTVRGIKAHVWFYDPFPGRGTLIEAGDRDEAAQEGAKRWFEGRKAAKPWLRTLRSSHALG